jgi:hypothetical protein
MLQERDGEAYDKLTRDNDNPSGHPFELVEEPPSELGLSPAEQDAWRAAVAKLKARRDKGKPNPSKKPADGGYSKQMAYVCHTAEDQLVTLYMEVAECTDAAPCHDLDSVV